MPATLTDGGSAVPPRDKLFRMWELPATWALLRLSSPAGAQIPDLPTIAAALSAPNDHPDIIAALHARALNIPPSAAVSRWLPGLRRAARQRRADFDPIFGTAPEPESSSESGAESDSAKEAAENEDDDEGNPLASFESYANLTAEQRMQTLHTVAELGAVDAEVAPVPAARVAELDVTELRMGPIGTDAAGNDYWYFGDCAHVFREPGRRVKKRGPEEIKRAAKEARLRKEEEKRARIEERKRIAAEKRAEKLVAKEKREQQREQERLARRAKWAPRAATARVTRASRAATIATATVSTEPDTNDGRNSSVDVSGTEHVGDKRVRSDSEPAQSGEDASTTPRASKRQRRSTPAMQQHEEEIAAANAGRRKSTGSVKGGEALRHCVRWEPVCGSLEELRAFVEPFGYWPNVSNRNERALIKFLTEELIPVFEETENRLRKERLKRERSEWLLVNQKRSSRVQAMEARREAEKDRERELEEELRKEELRKEQRQLDIVKMIEDLARAQIKELRAARRARLRPDQIEEARKLLEADEKAERDEQRRRDSAVGKRGARVSMRILRGSRRDSEDGDIEDVDDIPDVEEEEDYEPESEQDSEPESADDDLDIKALQKSKLANMEMLSYRPGPGGQSAVVPMEIDAAVSAPNEREAQDVAMSSTQDVSAGNMEESKSAQTPGTSTPKAENVVDENPASSKLTSAIVESKIPDELNWVANADEGLPFRALNHFIFINKMDCSEVPVEAVDNKSISVVALGVLVPPKGSEVDPVRVEIDEISDWVIEYGQDSRIWVKTKQAWYELIRPHLDYRSTFSSALRKFELCVRIFVLGDEEKVSELGYESVVSLLGMRYNDMRRYKESDIRGEYEFILSQVDDLKHKKLLSCGFIKELRSWKRAENRKAKKLAGKKSTLKKKTLASKKENEKIPEADALTTVDESAPNPKRRRSAGGPPSDPPKLAVVAAVNSQPSPLSGALPVVKQAGSSSGVIKTASGIGGSPEATNGQKCADDAKDVAKVAVPPELATVAEGSGDDKNIGNEGKSKIGVTTHISAKGIMPNGIVPNMTRENAGRGGSAGGPLAKSKENAGITERNEQQTLGSKVVDNKVENNFEEARAGMSSEVVNGKRDAIAVQEADASSDRRKKLETDSKKQVVEPKEGNASSVVENGLKKHGVAIEKHLIQSSGKESMNALKNANGDLSEENAKSGALVKEGTVAPNGISKGKSSSSSPGEVSHIDGAVESDKKRNGRGREDALEPQKRSSTLASPVVAEMHTEKAAWNGISVDKGSARSCDKKPDVDEAGSSVEKSNGHPKGDMLDAKLESAAVDPSSSS